MTQPQRNGLGATSTSAGSGHRHHVEESMVRPETTGAMRRLACATILIVIGACVARSQAPDQMLRLIGAPEPGVVSPSAQGADCLRRYAPADSALLAENCEAGIADTLRFSQVNREGHVLFEGKRIYVDAARLRRLADSIETAIERIEGMATPCPVDSSADPYTERLLLWHVRGRTWFLRTTTLDAPRRYPAIEFESDAGTRLCKDYIGPPMHTG